MRAIQVLAWVIGFFFCAGVVLDAFQTIILPRRPTHRFRLTRFFYIMTWTPWVAMAGRMKDRKVREQFYSIFGPLSLLVLLGVWASLLVMGFGLLYFALGTPFSDTLNPVGSVLTSLRSDLYVSGTTLFTLGLGDVTPKAQIVRALIVVEAGTGLGFVALVIGYIPVLYQAFSRREVSVALLDARAGSPPTSTELLRRHGYEGGEQDLIRLLAEWERWAAEILESHISYPLLCYYRSQHDNQSWLSALVAVLDTCALLITNFDGAATRQAQLTFAMARHALIDLGHVFHIGDPGAEPAPATENRLQPEMFRQICAALAPMHLRLCGDPAAQGRLTDIRLLYEPHAQALADYLKMPLPLWNSEAKPTDAWKRVANLRMGKDPIFGEANHVSDRSTADHLQEEGHDH